MTEMTFPYDAISTLNPRFESAPLRRFLYPDGHLGWIVGGYHTARAVLADLRFSSDAELKRVPVHRPGADLFIGQKALPGWFLDMDPPHHTVYRRLFASFFTLHRMKALRSRIGEIVSLQLGEMKRHGPPADLVDMFALPVALQSLCILLGVPYSERATIRKHRDTLFSLEASADAGGEAMNQLTGLLFDLIRRKQASPTDDLLGRVAATGEIPPEDLAGAGVLLLTAGHDTVASMLSLGTLALLLNPDQLATIDWAQPADDAIEELLRYLSIFHVGVPRMPLVDVELAGQLIKAGESVTVSIPEANRDPDRYPNPHTLDLARSQGSNLAFGHGVHQCIGQNLARIQMLVAYPALFGRFPNLRLAMPAHDIPIVKDGATYAAQKLWVAW